MFFTTHNHPAWYILSLFCTRCLVWALALIALLSPSSPKVDKVVADICRMVLDPVATCSVISICYLQPHSKFMQIL